MIEIRQKRYTGERALFGERDLHLAECTFADGESPLKECSNIHLRECLFEWKYPLWYGDHIRLENCTLFETARAGVWYTTDIKISGGIIEAPKTFRRSYGITLENVTLPNASETLWNCEGIQLKNVSARGDYFGMQSENVEIDGFHLAGNYAFDGAKNVSVRNARMITKDAFWNSENVTITDSFISGEYFGWNSKNMTLVNCTIESLQGLCYIRNLVMQNCKLLNTSRAFEYSTIDAEIKGGIDSICNPYSGALTADSIGAIVLERAKVDPYKTFIVCGGKPWGEDF